MAGSPPPFTTRLNQARRSCLQELDEHARRVVDPDEPGGGLPLSPTEPVSVRGKGIPEGEYAGKQAEVIKACPLVDVHVKPGLPPEGFGGRLGILDGLEGDMRYYRRASSYRTGDRSCSSSWIAVPPMRS